MGNNSKLTKAEVIEIRNSDLTTAKLRVKYNVNTLTITNILTGKTWGHLPGAREPIKPRQRNTRLTVENVLAIRKSSLKQYQLAKIYGVTQATVSNIIRGKTWQHNGIPREGIQKLTKEKVIAIRASKLTLVGLAKEYGVSQTTIWRALHGITFTELLGAKPLREKAPKQSGFKNICWVKDHEYWLAQFMLKGKMYYCGTYDFPGEAHYAVLEKRAALKDEGIE